MQLYFHLIYLSESMSEFYMTLPSNASLETFPKNTQSDFKVRLQQPLRLEGKWQVGVVEVHYPNSWNNVTDGKIIITQKPGSAKVMFVETGRYRTVEEILNAIHDQLSNFNIQHAITFFKNKIQNKCTVWVKETDLEIKLSENLANILGLQSKFYTYGANTGELQCDISEGFSSLFIYSNLVEPQVVGDVQARLLRVVTVKERSKEYNHVEGFQHVKYLPVANNRSETVEILIRRDDGRAVTFERGKVVVTLHFKRMI